MQIQLIGPGGAGKSTIGIELARRLGWRFFDLDQWFLANTGDIRGFIERFGYEAYASRNVSNYIALRESITANVVFALSSGFMVYPKKVHSRYCTHLSRIESSRSTFVLLPGLHLEDCVRETVRRQLSRPVLDGNAQLEELKIRQRFPMYSELRCKKISSIDPPMEVAARIQTEIAAILRR